MTNLRSESYEPINCLSISCPSAKSLASSSIRNPYHDSDRCPPEAESGGVLAGQHVRGIAQAPEVAALEAVSGPGTDQSDRAAADVESGEVVGERKAEDGVVGGRVKQSNAPHHVRTEGFTRDGQRHRCDHAAAERRQVAPADIAG